MKRTTYIIFGMLLAGLVVVIGGVFYGSMNTVKWGDELLDIGGEKKTVQLPECKVVQLAAIDGVMRQSSAKSINGGKRMSIFSNAPLTVCPEETAQGTFIYTSGLDKYMTIKSSGDTLRILLDFSNEKLEEKYLDMFWLNMGHAEMVLNLPEGVQEVASGLYDQEVTVKDFDRDTLSLATQSRMNMENCRFRALTVSGGNPNFNSGEVKDLHLYLDAVRNWGVNAESFHVDTEYLYAHGTPRCTLEKGECRQVVWMPQSAQASLDIKLKEAARVVVE